MIVAVPNWQGRVSPVFDVAEQVLLVDLDHLDTSSGRLESLRSMTPHERVRRLTELRVYVLICGAISWLLEALLVSHGIQVIPLVCGEVDGVIEAFRDGTIQDKQQVIPGRRRRRRQGRKRRRGAADY